MPATSTFAVPLEQAERLRQLTKIDGRPAGRILAELIDTASLAAGLETPSNAVSVRLRPGSDLRLISLFGGTYLTELSAAGVEAMADHLAGAADRGSSNFLYIPDDHREPPFSIWRRGHEVIFEVEALARAPGASSLGAKHLKIALRKVLTVEEAREIAASLRAGVGHL